MAKYNKDDFVENKKIKKLRIFMAVMFFIEVILTTFPFVVGVLDNGSVEEMIAFQMFIQIGGYKSGSAFGLAALGAVFVLFPLAAFFFCVLDKKSNVKYLVSAACAILCVALMCFGINGAGLAIGAVVSIILYVLILFVTMYTFLTSNTIQ